MPNPLELHPELKNGPRLRVFSALAGAPDSTLTNSELAKKLGMSLNSIPVHTKAFQNGGLIEAGPRIASGVRWVLTGVGADQWRLIQATAVGAL
jgi:DNA-binding transcriptional ArsR family regulator